MSKKTNKKIEEDTNELIADADGTEAGGEEMGTAEIAEIADENEGLVKMHLNGTSLHVHPTTVAAHQSAGWKVA